ncbi:MAG TPA: NnrU family protein [Casimicrobiaceae bacterium]|jgi:uncharacterized membrane protein
MTTLIAGLVLFLGVHLLPTVPAFRGNLVARWGESRYKGLFSLVSFAGLALIIAGYAMAQRGAQLFPPQPAAIAVAPYAMTVAFILFAAANMPGHLRQTLKHPMLIGLLIWSIVHLLANGDVRGTVLFGSFIVYAIVDLFSAIQRHAAKTAEPRLRADVIAFVAGIVVALILMTLHRVLFGVRVVPFGI